MVRVSWRRLMGSLSYLMVGLYLLFCLVCLILYLLPSFLALDNNHPNKFSVIFVNVFLGFTCVGWIIALIWAVSDKGPGKS